MKILRFQGKKNYSAISEQALRDMNAEQETLALQSHFKELLKVLQDSRQDSLPWFIVLGSEECGKTSWLTNTAYRWNYVIPSVFALRSPELATNTPLLHPICARLNDEGVFIEIPGRYLAEKNHKSSVWETFLKLIKKNKVQSRLRGVILMLGLDNLSQWSANQHQNHISLIRNCLNGLTQITKHPLHLQILFSKADTILGFNEFFSESLHEERSDVFGIEFPEHTFGAAIPSSHIFNEQFALLLVKLNERIISLLHRERLLQKKALISDFPQQFAAFKGLVNRYIYDLIDMAPYKNKILVSSVYFFSNSSNGKTEDQLAKLLSIYSLPERESYQEGRKSKSYFSRHLIKKLGQLRSVPLMPSNRIPAISQRNGIIFLMIVTFFFLTYLGISFYQKTQAIYQIQKSYSGFTQKSFSEDNNQNLFSQVQSLTYLNNIILLLRDMPLSFLITFSWHPLHGLQTQAVSSYQEILQKQFVPSLTNSLTTELLRASTANVNHIYSNLKAYISLKNPKKNAAYLTEWLQEYLQEQKFNNAKSLQFKSDGIDFAHWTPVQLDESAIFHAQNILNHLPKPLLAYLLLREESAKVVTTFPEGFESAFVYPEKLNNISAIYTQAEIVDVYFSKIPDAVKVSFSGNEVLGRAESSNSNSNVIASNIDKVRAFYLMDYVKRWQHILGATEIKLAHDYSQELAIIDALIDKSLFEKFLQEVVHEMVLDARELTKNRSLSEQKQFYYDVGRFFQWDEASNQIFTAKPFVLNKAIKVELLKIKKSLESISHGSNVEKASFETAIAEYRNQKLFGKLAAAAFSAPSPLSRWLISLISNEWLIVLEQSRNYVNHAWEQSVLPEYRSKVSARYPLVKQSNTDVELADFAHFFGKAGTLDLFFNRYLKPFVDASGPRWQWQQLYGQTLSNQQNLPLQFERAALMRKMFFAKTGELAVDFYLTPVGLGPTLRSVQLNIDGHVIENKPSQMNIMPLSWPGDKNREGSSVLFNRVNGQQETIHEQGPWSLFRLLDAAYVQSLKDSRHFLLTFDLNGNAAKYQLSADNVINPFIPDFITQFNCAEKF